MGTAQEAHLRPTTDGACQVETIPDGRFPNNFQYRGRDSNP